MFVVHRDLKCSYLEVTIEELCRAGVHPGELTENCRRNKQWMYLPQGPDIKLFIDRWKARFPDDEMDYAERWGTAFIRKLKHHHPLTPEQIEARIVALGYTMEELIDATR